MLKRLFALLFPPKCVLCQTLLDREETDFCRRCRLEAPEFPKTKIKIPFLAGWTSVWYYKGDVRSSILRYKFWGRRHYVHAYGRVLAMKVQTARLDDFEILTWAPISKWRRFTRGFDQVELLAHAVARELGCQAVPTLKKIRHTPPQSRIRNASARRANILGAYRVTAPENVRGKKILLLDDIITTGSTASEVAKTLQIAGAREIFCAALAAAPHDKIKM